jgi:hypothetical protein
VREETNLVVQLKGVAGITECEMPNTHLVTIYFHTAMASGTVALSGEHDDFTWLPVADIQTLNLNSQIQEFLKQYSASGTNL